MEYGKDYRVSGGDIFTRRKTGDYFGYKKVTSIMGVDWHYFNLIPGHKLPELPRFDTAAALHTKITLVLNQPADANQFEINLIRILLAGVPAYSEGLHNFVHNKHNKSNPASSSPVNASDFVLAWSQPIGCLCFIHKSFASQESTYNPYVICDQFSDFFRRTVASYYGSQYLKKQTLENS